MKEFTLELSDGREVTVVECWDCDSSRSLLDVYDKNDGTLLVEFYGSMPDTDDEDFDLDRFRDIVEEEFNCNGIGY